MSAGSSLIVVVGVNPRRAAVPRPSRFSAAADSNRASMKSGFSAHHLASWSSFSKSGISSFLSFIAHSFLRYVEIPQLWSRRKRRDYANPASTPRRDNDENSQGIRFADLHQPVFAVSELLFQTKRIVRYSSFSLGWCNTCSVTCFRLASSHSNILCFSCRPCY